MSVILKDSNNSVIYTWPSGTELVNEPFTKRLETESRAYAHGGVLVSDEKVSARVISVHGIFNKTSQALIEAELNSMKKACYTEDLRLYATQYANDFYNVECLSFEHNFLGMLTVVEINVDFLVSDPFRYYKDLSTDTHYLSKCLSFNGSGYASIADGSQKGLDMGYSDFMEGIWIKTSSAAIFPIIYKGGVGGYFDLHLNATTGYLECKINDGTNTATITGDIALNDDEWHLVRVSIDKSSTTGGRLYVDGAEDTSAQTNVTSVLDIDNDGIFYVGYDGSNFAIGKFDEPEIWNFGYGGLPADVADYDTWRYANPYAALSEYNSGSWNGYADADRTEVLTDPGIESWTGDTPDEWTEEGEEAGVQDITKETVEIHGGAAAAKFEVTNAVGGDLSIKQTTSPTANKYYSLSAWIYFPTRTAGVADFYIYGVGASKYALSSTNAAFTYCEKVFDIGAFNTVYLRLKLETTTGIAYFDDVSLKRVGLVAHWKFNGDYLDEGSNDNDLTAGGSGNSFVLASLPNSIVANAGDIEAFPIITFTAGGTITNVKVENAQDNGKYFNYSGSLILDNVLEVDCQEGMVKKNGSDDIANFADSFIKLASGDNTITVTITGTPGDSNLKFEFRKRWL